MSKKSSKKFDLAESLKGESDVHAVDSDAIGTPDQPARFHEKSEIWSYFRRVPYKAQVVRVHKSAARRAHPEWLYFVTWSQFSKEWDCYLWEDALIASTPDVCTAMLAKQRSAFTAKSGGGGSRKRRAASTETADNADADEDYYDQQTSNAAASTAGGGAGSTAANNKRDRATDELLRAPILPVINEPPISVQMRNRRAGDSVAGGAYVPQDASIMQIAMPGELVDLLMRGQAWVKDAGFTLPLPRCPSVITILNEFAHDGNEVDRVSRVAAANAFVAIFDSCFALLLLYKNERAQYERLKAPERRGPSTVYGAEHLLRFMSRAPDVLATVPMEREVFIMYERMLNALALFLKSKRFDYFLEA